MNASHKVRRTTASQLLWNQGCTVISQDNDTSWMTYNKNLGSLLHWCVNSLSALPIMQGWTFADTDQSWPNHGGFSCVWRSQLWYPHGYSIPCKSTRLWLEFMVFVWGFFTRVLQTPGHLTAWKVSEIILSCNLACWYWPGFSNCILDEVFLII